MLKNLYKFTKLGALFLILLLTAAATSCHSNKNVLSNQAASAGARQADSWTNVYANVNVSMSQPMSMSFNARVTMERDKYIYLSMRVLGMEAVAIYIDTDSAYFIDKYHKYLFAEPLSVILGQRFNYLTLSDIQQILLGRKVLTDIDPVSIETSDYVETPAGEVASLVSVFAPTEQGTIRAQMAWKPAQATWNDPSRSYSLKIPAGYSRITPDNLRTMLKSMSF